MPCVHYRRYGNSKPFTDGLEQAWSLRRLLNVCGAGIGAKLSLRFGKDTYARWETEGIPDFEADAACIFLDKMPHTVFHGWYEAADWYGDLDD